MISVQISGAIEFLYRFQIAPEILEMPKLDQVVPHNLPMQKQINERLLKSSGQFRTINGVAVPNDFPEIFATEHAPASPGKIFFSSTFGDIGNYLVILENDDTSYFYRKYPTNPGFYNANSIDFKLQSTGVLSAYLVMPSHYIILNDQYEQIDIYKCKGYGTNSHDLKLLPNGHALIIGNETRRIDMSKFVSGGRTNAKVTGQIFQELDQDKIVIFEWRGLDYFDVTDATHENLTNNSIDLLHMNSVDVDYDGHYIISCRNISEVTKINRETGNVLWRLGGVNNQFHRINDPHEMSYQHHTRPVPGKHNHYTINDNGIHLIFNKFGDTYVDHYNIYGDTNKNPTQLITSTEKTYTVLSDLKNDTYWYFRVTSVDGSGVESDYSNEVNLRTQFIKPGTNMVKNGDFSNGTNDWQFNANNGASASLSIDDSTQCHFQIEDGGTDYWHVKLAQEDFMLVEGKQYRFEFDAYTDANRIIEALVIRNASPWDNYGKIALTALKTEKQHFSYDFTMTNTTDWEAAIVIQCGTSAGDVYIDNVSLIEVETAGIDDKHPAPGIFALHQNYPNPFNSSTTIHYDLSHNTDVSLIVYDLRGREIETVIRGFQTAGSHQVEFKGGYLSSGVYLMVFKAGEYTTTQKMILLK